MDRKISCVLFVFGYWTFFHSIAVAFEPRLQKRGNWYPTYLTTDRYFSLIVCLLNRCFYFIYLLLLVQFNFNHITLILFCFLQFYFGYFDTFSVGTILLLDHFITWLRHVHLCSRFIYLSIANKFLRLLLGKVVIINLCKIQVFYYFNFVCLCNFQVVSFLLYE